MPYIGLKVIVFGRPLGTFRVAFFSGFPYIPGFRSIPAGS
jgi:hypothetical protein